MATYSVTTANWNDPAFWSSISQGTAGHTLDFSALPASYSVFVDPVTGTITLSDGATTFVVGEAGYGGTADATLGGTTLLSYFTGLTGGAGNDTLWGTAGNDTLSGRAGDDILRGGTGNDRLLGGDGADTILLENNFDRDTIYGGEGGTDSDLVDLTSVTGPVTVDYYGNEQGIVTDGLDTATFYEIEGFTLTGQADFLTAGADSLGIWADLGAGDDTAWTGLGADTIHGADGADEIYGDAGNDSIEGGTGNDNLGGDAGDDTVRGGAGDDYVEGDIGADLLSGGTGNDYITGGADADTIQVEDGFGTDTILGGETATTGSDDDAIDLSALTGPVSVTATGVEAGTVTDGTDTLTFTQVERLILTDFADTVVGNADTVGIAIDAGAGNDRISSDDGADSVLGGDGNDTITTNDNDDTLDGGAGNDSLTAGFGDDLLIGGDGNDYLSDGYGADTLYGGAGDDTLWAGRSDFDLIYGDDGADLINVVSQMGQDTIYGGEGGTDLDTLDFYFFDYVPQAVTVTYSGDEAGTFTDGIATATFYEIEHLSLTDQADSVNGSLSSAAISIDGLDGYDTLIGGAGDDTFLGGAGNDSLLGGAGADSIDGGANNDRIFGEDGADTLDGGIGSDTIYGGADNDLIYGGGYTGNADQLHGDDGDDTIYGGDGAGYDLLYGDAGDDLLDGRQGNDTIQGGTGSDTIHGGAGDDSLLGGEDGDTFVIEDGFGADIIAGGETVTTGVDLDVIDLSLLTGAVTVTYAGDALGAIMDGSDTLTFSEIERLILTGLDDVVEGAGDSVGFEIDAGAGDDSLRGGSGDDTLIGGDGNDTLIAGTNTGAGDSLSGGAGDDVLTDSYWNATLDGGDGADLFNVGYGVATVSGGEGGTDSDTLSFALADDAVNVTVSGDELGSYGDIDGDSGTFSGIEVFELTSENDTLNASGDSSGIEVLAGAGNDTVTGGSGADRIDGEAGNDSLSGGAGADTLAGGTGADTILGGDDADRIVVEDGFGNDSIWGGEGGTDADTLDLSAVTTDLDFRVGGTEWGNVTVGTDTLKFWEIEDFILGQGDDQLSFGTNSTVALWADGQAGNDTLLGSSYDDTFIGGEGDDRLYGNGGADSLVGDAGQDSVYAGSGDDTVYAGEGSDLVDGGDGADYINTRMPVGTGLPDIAYPGSYSADTDPLGDRDTVYGGIGNDTILTGDDADLVYGGDDNDSIEGGFDADTLFGDEGNDTVIGGEGSDLVEGGGGDDFLVGGYLPTDAYFFDMPDAGDAVTNNDRDTIQGGAGNDTIYGYDDADSLSGDDGQDVLFGGADDDTLTGGLGDDALTGGEGDDRFVYVAGDGADTIADFNAGASGTLDDGIGTNNDFIDLSAFYDNLQQLYADQADDGVLNQSNTLDAKGRAVDYSDNDQFAGGSLTFTGATADNSFYTQENTAVVCFAAGTLILTETGEVPVETLRPGDRVVTRDDGPRPLVWIATRRIGPAELARNPRLRPVILSPALTGGAAPLTVSAQHGLVLARRGGDEVLVRATHLARLRGGQARIARGARQVSYFHLMFERHQIVFANGAPAESFYPGPQAVRALTPAARRALLRVLPAAGPAPLAAARPLPGYGPTARPFARFRELPASLRALAAW
ncbi:Hint domain-containing protein [Rhodovulum marinum]|uniref:Hemolysin type calcium-binding protein n=1 Tax=Rhodovulum marinum TaxID=320662 RepID=A0A4R2Q8I9_9RHOB|nr:Hint domain-containing protein [Rhodovulum marinum]TCP44298.1 hemolysin type calcium-binding protein [Rhodovulum marinum]